MIVATKRVGFALSVNHGEDAALRIEFIGNS
jgi:hypothetical protein